MTSTTAQRAVVWLRRLENGVLAGLVLLLVGLAATQIILRDAFQTGIAWADPLMRDLVLWTGMLGALAAVGGDKHIALDLASRFLGARAQRIARTVTLGFTALVCAAMCWFSYALVHIDFSGATPSSSMPDVPAWVPEAILPVAFALMAVRFALHAISPPANPPESAPALLHDPAAPPK